VTTFHTEGFFTLPVPIGIRQGLLGNVSPLDVDGSHGEIALPLKPEGDAWGLQLPVLNHPVVAKRYGFTEPDPPWGSLTFKGDDGTVHAQVRAVVLRFEPPVPIADIRAPLLRWFQRTAEWLTALTEQDLHEGEPYPFVREILYEPSLCHFDSAGELVEPHIIRLRTTYPVHNPPHLLVDSAQWQRAVHEASAARFPPLPRQLLNSARAALARHRLRRSVIDAGTAAEVAAVDALRKQMSGVPAQVQDAVLERKTLGALVGLCQKLGVLLPSNTLRDLVNPRNDAAHHGVDPSLKVATGAVALARQIVHSHCPL
jgi:hypothetical protein